MKIIFALAVMVATASAANSQTGGDKCTPVEVDEIKITICIPSEDERGPMDIDRVERLPPPTEENFLRDRDAACSLVELAAWGSNPVCSGAWPIAVPVLKYFKDTGQFRDLGHCEEVARDAAWLAGVLGFKLGGEVGAQVAYAIAGGCGECACRLAY